MAWGGVRLLKLFDVARYIIDGMDWGPQQLGNPQYTDVRDPRIVKWNPL